MRMCIETQFLINICLMYMDGRSRVAFTVEIMQFCLMNSRQTRRYFNLYNVILIGPYITGKFNVYYFSMFICNAFFMRHNFLFVFNVPSYIFFSLSHSANKNDVHVVIWPSNNFRHVTLKNIYWYMGHCIHTYPYICIHHSVWTKFMWQASFFLLFASLDRIPQ